MEQEKPRYYVSEQVLIDSTPPLTPLGKANQGEEIWTWIANTKTKAKILLNNCCNCNGIDYFNSYSAGRLEAKIWPTKSQFFGNSVVQFRAKLMCFFLKKSRRMLAIPSVNS